MFPIKVTVANFRTVLSGELDRVKVGVTSAIDAGSVQLQAQLRSSTASLGPGVANAWRRQRYPQSRPSLNAAALVWSRAPNIIDGFNKGALIRPSGGRQWLAIALKAAGRGPRGQAITPREFARRRGVELRLVPIAPNRALLVVDGRLDGKGLARRGRRRRAGKFGPMPASEAATVPVFLLIRQAKLPKRLDLQAAANTAAGNVAAAITRNLG